MPSYAIVLSFQGWKVPRTQPLEASNSSSLPPFRLDGWQIRAVAYPICGVLPCRRCRHTSSWEASSWLCASACPSRATPVSRRTAVGALNLHISSQFITFLLGTLGFWRSRCQKCTKVRCRRQIRICAPLCFVEVSCFVEASWRTNAVFWNMEFDPGSLSSGNKDRIMRLFACRSDC